MEDMPIGAALDPSIPSDVRQIIVNAEGHVLIIKRKMQNVKRRAMSGTVQFATCDVRD